MNEAIIWLLFPFQCLRWICPSRWWRPWCQWQRCCCCWMKQLSSDGSLYQPIALCLNPHSKRGWIPTKIDWLNLLEFQCQMRLVFQQETLVQGKIQMCNRGNNISRWASIIRGLKLRIYFWIPPSPPALAWVVEMNGMMTTAIGFLIPDWINWEKVPFTGSALYWLNKKLSYTMLLDLFSSM